MNDKEKEVKEVKEDYKCTQCNAVTFGDSYEDARSHADSSNHVVLGELYIPTKS